jgi:hypothetical protein
MRPGATANQSESQGNWICFAVIACQVHARRRHQRRQARHQLQRLEHDLRRAIAVRRLERITDLALGGQCQALAGHGRATHVTAQPLLQSLIELLVEAEVNDILREQPAAVEDPQTT